MPLATLSEGMFMTNTVAGLVADYLSARGVTRIFGLCGGHIQPMWDEVARRGIDIVDVRHEGAAIFMAHAAAEITGTVGVAMITAGPGVTNATTGIANAFISGVPLVVISGRVPRPQSGMGAMQDLPQSGILAPICQSVHEVWDQRHVIAQLDAAFAAAQGSNGRPGPAYIDFPVDLQEEPLYPTNAYMSVPGPVSPAPPAQQEVEAGSRLLRAATKVLVISGRGAFSGRPEMPEFVDRAEAIFLNSAESKGLLPLDNPSYVPAVRGRAMREADLVITLGRRLDFQLGYGSPAVFAPEARFLRIGQNYTETGENRRGDVEIQADVGEALRALLAADMSPREPDRGWIEELRSGNKIRAHKLAQTLAAQPVGDDGRIHPYTLINALNGLIEDDTIVVADGGDILSFARIALKAPTYLDCGPLGCLGVGVPFATSAAISSPNRRVVALIGDGSFGFHGVEINTAVRHHAHALFVVANNEAWNIERQDQIERYDGNLVGVDLAGCRYDLMAKGLGAHGERVERLDELGPALARAQANLPAVVDVLVTRNADSPDFLSGLATVPAYQALSSWDQAERRLRGR